MNEQKKIILVEDDRMLSFTFEMFLKQLDYILVGSFQTGKDAIEGCRKLNPDVVIMDIHLEGELDGIDTAKTIEREFDLPIVYLSSDIEEATFLKTIHKNTFGFLVKPISKKASLRMAIEFAYYKHKFNNGQLTN